MSFEDMKDAAHAYAADLRERGYLDVTVYRFDTPMDNREPFRRDHVTAFGWAVRFTSDEATDAAVWAGSDGERKGWPRPKYHDRSLTVFTDDAEGLPMGNLISNGGVLADIAGEDVTPYWVAGWSPDGRPAHVQLKRFGRRETDQSYPWQLGPRKFYHLIMTPDTPARFTRGPEPASLTDR